MLELKGVSKTYAQTAAVENLDLAIPPRQTTVLIGPSGCGKSTLLRIMIGLIWPDRGSVLLKGLQLAPNNALLLRQQMGYVIQDGRLFPHLTAKSNVAVMARSLGCARHPAPKRITQLA